MKRLARLLASVPILFLGALPLAPLPGPLAAQEKVASKQERAELKFKDLHERMQKLQSMLASTEPEQSRVLSVGNRFIQEKRIAQRMGDIKKLMHDESWDESLEQMKGVRKDLSELMDLLQNRNLDLQKLLEEIARLEAFKQRVDKLIQEQQAEKEASGKSEALEQHLKELQKAQAQLEELIKKQTDLRGEANQSGMAAPPETAKAMEGKQGELKNDAEKTAEELKKLEEKHQQLKAGDAKADAKGAPAKGDAKGGEAGEGGGSCPCAGAAGGAAQAMGKAQQKLQANKPEHSIEDMDKALDKLKEAKKALDQLAEETMRELLQLPFEQQIRAQEQTRIDTDKLAKDMEEAGKKAEGEKKETPGQENVQQAVPKQKAAAGMLKEHKPGKARQDQQDAKEDLDEAKKKLEDALAQLRQQLQDEVLRSLEERFGAMLAKQKDLSARTKVTDRLKGESLAAGNQVPAALAQRCAELGQGELELAGEAAEAQKLLEEEGTTAVFPELVAELKADLKKAGGRLHDRNTGAATQAMQAEIEAMLTMLIDALRRAIEDSDAKGGH
jgi:hypothetical protein